MLFLFRINLNKALERQFIPAKIRISIDIYQFLHKNTYYDTNRTYSVIFKSSYTLFL